MDKPSITYETHEQFDGTILYRASDRIVVHWYKTKEDARKRSESWIDYQNYLKAREVLEDRIIIHQTVPAIIDPNTGEIVSAGEQTVMSGADKLDELLAQSAEAGLEFDELELAERMAGSSSLGVVEAQVEKEIAQEAPEVLDSYNMDIYNDMNGDQMGDEEWMRLAYPEILQQKEEYYGSEDDRDLIARMKQSVADAREAVDETMEVVASSDEESSQTMDVSNKVKATTGAVFTFGKSLLEKASKAGDGLVGDGNGKWLVTASTLGVAGLAYLVAGKIPKGKRY